MLILDTAAKLLSGLIDSGGSGTSVSFSLACLLYDGGAATFEGPVVLSNGATPVTLRAAPTSGQVIVKSITIVNSDSVEHTVTVRVTDTTSGTVQVLVYSAVIAAGDSVEVMTDAANAANMIRESDWCTPSMVAIATGSFTMTAEDTGHWIGLADSSDQALALPAASDVPARTLIAVINKSDPSGTAATQHKLTAAGSDLISFSNLTTRTVVTLLPGNFVILESNGTNVWFVRKCLFDTSYQDAGATVITATTTNPTKSSTVVTDKVLWRRHGMMLYLKVDFNQTGTSGTAGSGTYLIEIPCGFVVDTTLQPVVDTTNATRIIGSSISAPRPNSYASKGQAVIYDSTHVTWSAYGTFFDDSHAPLSGAVSFTLEIEIPIVDW